VVAIHADCAVLMRYANSRRVRRHFYNKSSEVRSIPATAITVPPAADFGKLIEDTLGAHELETANNALLRRIASAAHRKFFRRDCCIRAPVHCECALVHYFNEPTVVSDEIPPINFLGVSKLPCNACTMFIEASNRNRKRKFYIGGCRGKWSFPWALPPSGQPITSAFLVSMSSYIAGLLVWKGVARPRSDADNNYNPTDPEDFILSEADDGDSETDGDDNEIDEANLDWARRTLKSDFWSGFE